MEKMNLVPCNPGENEPEMIKRIAENNKFFPAEFYEANKEKIENGTIKFLFDGWGTEVGCLIDFETGENLIIDVRGI